MKLDIRDRPAYTLAEAARYVKVPQATVRNWFVGQRAVGKRPAQNPVICPASPPPAPMLSFWNLIEAHVLRSLRTDHRVPMDLLRAAINYAQQELGIERLLLHRDLRAHGGTVLLQEYEKLIDLPRSGQIVLRETFDQHLRRVHWEDARFPIKLFPCISGNAIPGENQPIAMSASIAFGRPVLVRGGIKTSAIVGRIDAGETVEEIATDYGIESNDVAVAMRYERAA